MPNAAGVSFEDFAAGSVQAPPPPAPTSAAPPAPPMSFDDFLAAGASPFVMPDGAMRAAKNATGDFVYQHKTPSGYEWRDHTGKAFDNGR